MDSKEKAARRRFSKTAKAHDLAKLLLLMPKESLIKRIDIDHRGFFEGHDFKKHYGRVATLKRWEAQARKKAKATKSASGAGEEGT